MGDKVFINGRSAVHAGSSGKSMCFPDVNLCPPTPPAGPIPLPLPNMAQAMDMQGGASSVTIGDNPMGKQSSFFAKSTGNESAQSTGGGVVSHVVQGKAYFTSFSFDVTIEGEPAVRHLDMMTHNHAAQTPPNAAMGTYLAMMDPAMVGSATAPAKRKDDSKPQSIEFYLDQHGGSPSDGIDAMRLVSTDKKYDKKVSAKAATSKGGLLWLKFENVLPGKAYSLYLVTGDQEFALFDNLPFASIVDHAAGDEKPPAPASADKPPKADDDFEWPEPPDDPDDWYEKDPWEK